MVGQGGRPGSAPLGVPGGDRPSRQGDRDGGQGGRDGAACARPHGRCRVSDCRNCTSPTATRSSRRAAMGRRKRRKPSPEPASRRPATRMRRSGWRPTTAYGSAATCEAILPSMRTHAAAFLSDVEARPEFARGRRRASRRRDHLLVRRRVSRRRGIIWNARSPCSNPAATTIWPFASGKTPASRQCATWRLRRGRWAKSSARFPSLTACTTRLASVTHIGTHALCEIARGDVRIDARRQGARRDERF